MLQDRTIVAPGPERQLGELRYLDVIVGQFALAPVMHHQQQIRAVLRRRQMAGIAEIVADIKRHPRSLHALRPSLNDASKCFSSAARGEQAASRRNNAARCATRSRNGRQRNLLNAAVSSALMPPPRAATAASAALQVPRLARAASSGGNAKGSSSSLRAADDRKT